MIRPTKLGMKNWMFFGSLEAGANNALIYTLLANCRAQRKRPKFILSGSVALGGWSAAG